MAPEERPNRDSQISQPAAVDCTESYARQVRAPWLAPPLQQAREILASLRLEGTKFRVDDELLKRLERNRGLKVAVATRKLSAGKGFTGAAVQIGDALVIVCPDGGDALKAPVIAHEVAHIARGDPGLDLEAVTKALNECTDLPFIICDPETELRAECTAAALVVLARKPDSRLRRAFRRIGAALFGQKPGSTQRWRETAESHTRYFDVDR